MVDQGNPSKEKIEKAFDDYSSLYDESTGESMVYLTNLMLRETKIPKIPVCLDVASGTGISTFELLKRCNGKGTFYGIDISQSMIEIAENNASKYGFTGINFKKGDAEHLEFPDSMFDLVICNMSFHFFPDKKKALSEMYRVLKPGGQVALLYWGSVVFKRFQMQHLWWLVVTLSIRAFLML